MVRSLTLRLNFLTSCSVVAIVAVSVVPPALADSTTTSAGAIYSLGGGVPVSTTVTNPPNNADILPSGGDLVGNSVFGHVYSYPNGVIGSRSSGVNVFNIQGTATYTQIFTPTLTGAYVFNYLITGGELSVNMTSGTQQSASLSAVITETVGATTTTLLNYASSMNLSGAGATPTFSETGLTLGSAPPTLGTGSGDYTWNDYSGFLDLGTLAAGQSVQIDYTIVSQAIGNSPGTLIGGGGSCYGQTGLAVTATAYGDYGGCGSYYSFEGSALARIGDPDGLDVTNGPLNFGVTPVPEPASMAALGAGLAGLAFARRKRSPSA